MTPTFEEVLRWAMLELDASHIEIVGSPDGTLVALVTVETRSYEVKVTPMDRREHGDALAVSNAVAELRDKIAAE